jgi:AcrR family transcriptional regulator
MSRRSDHDQLIWLREEPGARRPTHSRAQIAAAAVEIADREGFEAVSMRRVARELGSGTMTLYHYVRNKDELITLMHDAVMSELIVPEEEMPKDWREALSTIAERSRAGFARHPWTLERIGDIAIGPSGIHHFEQSLQAVRDIGLPVAERLHVLSLVDEYVMGYSLRQSEDWGGQISRDEGNLQALAGEFFGHDLDTGHYPMIEELMREDLEEPDLRRATATVMEMISDPARFEHGLSQLLDGVEASLPKRKPRAR